MGLAESLAKDGFEVWTPIEIRSIRVPRMNARRDVSLPIMPGYVFARAIHLIDLLLLAAMPVKPRRGAGLREPAHSDFHVLKCCGRLAFVHDGNLDGLRHLQAKLTPAKKAERAFPTGKRVKAGPDSGSFVGLRGTVEKSNRGETIVCFNDRFTVKIRTCLLEEDAVSGEGLAALQAA
jgi:hypothetical protein